MSDEQFCQIRVRKGNFNLADPSETSTKVKVVLPEYDFEHSFTFDEQFYDDYKGLHKEPWNEAIYAVANARRKLMGDLEPQERLQEIHSEHADELRKEWEEYRVEQIDQKIAALREEKRRLQ